MARLDPNDPRLADPAFPHGQMRGYKRGCSCADCRAANAEQTAQRVARLTGKPRSRPIGSLVNPPQMRDHLAVLLRGATPHAVANATGVNPSVIRMLLADPDKHVAQTTADKIMATRPEQVRGIRGRLPVGPCVRHIHALMAAVPEANPDTIGRASGVSDQQIRRLAAGKRVYVKPDTALAIVRTTPEQVRACLQFVSAKRTHQQVRSLQAQDWRISDIAAGLGYKTRGLPFMHHHTVTADLARRVNALATRIGDRRGDCPRAGRWARKHGWYPAICYDEHGDLIPDAVRDDVADRRSARAEAEARRYRDRLRAVSLAAAGLSNTEVAAIVGCSRKDVERRKAADRDVDGIGMLGCPDPAALHALVDEAAEGIDVRERLDLFDADVDYKARWETLMAAAWALRTGHEAA